MLEAHHFNSSRALSWNNTTYNPFYGRTPSEPSTDKIRQYQRNRTCSLNSTSSDRNWSFSNESSSGKHNSPLSVVPESQSVVESEEGTTVYNNFSYEHDAVDDTRSCTSEPTTPSKPTAIERTNSIGKYSKHKRPSASSQDTEITLSIDEEAIDMQEKPTGSYDDTNQS